MKRLLVRTCKFCEEQFYLDQEEVEYCQKGKMLFPFFICKPCCVSDKSDLNEIIEDPIKEAFVIKIGTPEGRSELWKEIEEDLKAPSFLNS